MLGIKTDSGDIQISNGALLIGDISEQITEHILIANPGDYKEKPQLGLSINSYAGGIMDEFFPGKVKSQLKSQHLAVKSILITETDIDIEL